MHFDMRQSVSQFGRLSCIDARLEMWIWKPECATHVEYVICGWFWPEEIVETGDMGGGSEVSRLLPACLTNYKHLLFSSF